MSYAIEMGSGGIIYIRSFMKTGTGVQTILRSCFNNMRGCNIGITERRDL
jgi:hypothetical protein